MSHRRRERFPTATLSDQVLCEAWRQSCGSQPLQSVIGRSSTLTHLVALERRHAGFTCSAERPSRCVGLARPILLIRDANVVGRMPSNSAAPPGP